MRSSTSQRPTCCSASYRDCSLLDIATGMGGLWNLTHGRFAGGSKTRRGKGIRVVLLDVGGHLLTDNAAKVEVFAGVTRTHKATQLHGALREIRHLQPANLPVPQRCGLCDAPELLPEVFYRNRVIDVQKCGSENIG